MLHGTNNDVYGLRQPDNSILNMTYVVLHKSNKSFSDDF